MAFVFTILYKSIGSIFILLISLERAGYHGLDAEYAFSSMKFLDISGFLIFLFLLSIDMAGDDKKKKQGKKKNPEKKLEEPQPEKENQKK